MKLFGNFTHRAAAVGIYIIAVQLFVYAQGTNRNSTISGFVFDEARRPITNVVVELRDEYNSVVQRTRTQSSGRYNFVGLVQGRYTVYVRPFGTGLREQSEEVEISGIGVRGRQLADNAQKDIYLRATKERASEKLKNTVIFAQEAPGDAERLYKAGADDIDRQKTDTGIPTLEKAIAAFPTYFLALQKLAYVRLAMGNFPAAEPLFERALAVNPESYECLYGLGTTQYSLNKSKAAISTLEKAVIKRPNAFESFFVLAMARRQERQYEFAEKAFRQAIKLSDETTAPEAHWNLALLYAHNMGRYADAAKQLELYLKVAPDAPNKEAIFKLIKEFKGKANTSEMTIRNTTISG